MRRSLFRTTSFLIASVLLRAQSPGPATFHSSRPLADAAELLQQLYGKVVTYEDPVWLWRGDMESLNGRDPSLKWGVKPKAREFRMPAEAGTELDLPIVLAKTLDAYHQQVTGPRFRVLSSRWGIHIVPSQVQDETGVMVSTGSVLDSIVSVPLAERLPTQHLAVLMTMIQNASGIRIVTGNEGKPGAFNRLFLSAPPKFAWGAGGVTAREALIDLLQRSAIAYRWDLWCQPSAQAQDRFCSLTLSKSPLIPHVRAEER